MGTWKDVLVDMGKLYGCMSREIRRYIGGWKVVCVCVRVLLAVTALGYILLFCYEIQYTILILYLMDDDPPIKVQKYKQPHEKLSVAQGSCE